MQHFLLPLLALLLLLSAHSASGHKRWQRISPRTEYQGGDVVQYHQGGGEYAGGDVATSYGAAGYTNDFGGHVVGNAYNNYNGAGGNYGEQHQGQGQGGGGGYGGEQHQQVTSGDYGVQGASYSGYGQVNSGAYENGGFTGEEGGGYGVSNEGWDKPMKTVVKTIVKNIAVPHPVPAPVHYPVPRYVKYFKPLHIAKPVAVPHVIPVIKHIQKPMPFFASFPVRQSVPVPRFVGLPVQVRVPRPVFIAVPKIVPVAKKVPVAVPYDVPKPYIVPVYKQVPVPVPHKVPKIINVIKEVPHYVKKPVPVYVDDHPSVSQGGHTLTSSSYSNHYGNSDSYDSFGGMGFGGNEDMYGGTQGMNAQGGNGHSSMGYEYNKGNANDYGQQDTHNSLIFNNPFLFSKQGMQMMQNLQQQQQQQQQQQNLQVPSMSYPRAHRHPTKDGGTDNGMVNYQQQLNFAGYNYSSNNPGSSYAYDVNGNLVNTGEQQLVNSNLVNNAGASQNYNQGQTNAFTEMLMQNNNKATNPLSDANKIANMPLKVPLENPNSQFSQPIYNPSSYAEYAANQQAQYNNYSQSYTEQTSVQISETPPQTMEAQDSNVQYYNQHPGNAYSAGFNYQKPNQIHSSKYGKQQYSGNNFDYNGAFNNNNAKFNQESPYQNTFPPNQEYQSPWPSSAFSQNINDNVVSQMQNYNQQQVPYSQSPSQSNLGYNQGYNFGANPTSYGQDGFQQNAYRHNGNNPQESYQQSASFTGNGGSYSNYVPSGQSSSSSSFSESSSPHDQHFQSSVTSNSFVKQNEKYDHSMASYTSDSNAASPMSNSNSAHTGSYGGYGNNFNNPQNYAQQASNQMRNQASNQPGNQQINAQNQFNYPNQFGNAGQFGSFNNQFGDSSKFGNPSQFSDASQYSGGNQYGNQYNQYADQANPVSQQYSESSQHIPHQITESNQLSSQSQVNEPTYLNSPSGDQTSSGVFDSPMKGFDKFASSGSSSSFSPPTTSSTSYSSSGDFSPPADKSYLLPSNGFSPIVLNSTQERSSPPTASPMFTKSYSYSYTEKSGKTHNSAKKPSKLPDYMLKGKPEDSSPIVYSPQVDLPDLQSSSSKLDEMEEHIQSSASSIINFYTNSPESMGGGKGGTFSFVDPMSSSGSSPSVSFYQPQDSEASSQYSSEDMKVVAGPSYSQDPAEPLQTSLDAYVPLVQPVYQPNDQNTVYKEATSEVDEYKEAVSLNPNSEPSKKS